MKPGSLRSPNTARTSFNGSTHGTLNHLLPGPWAIICYPVNTRKEQPSCFLTRSSRSTAGSFAALFQTKSLRAQAGGFGNWRTEVKSDKMSSVWQFFFGSGLLRKSNPEPFPFTLLYRFSLRTAKLNLEDPFQF